MDALATVLLRRAGAVPLPAPAAAAPEDGAAWVAAFEADLAARGWLLDPGLRRRLAQLDPVTRMRWADWMSAVADELVGADRDHVPLFRRFPDTPADPGLLFIERILVALLQSDTAPCILCGTDDTVQPLDPCGHLVCTNCFDPALYSACPVCGRRLTTGNTFLAVVAPTGAGEPSQPLRLRRLTLDHDPLRTAERLRDGLVARPAALGAADIADLHTLVAATAPDRLDWLPEVVPARETLAVLIAWALHATAVTPAYGQVLAAATTRWRTVTDVARTLWAYSGGDPGLIVPRREPEPATPYAYRPAATVPIPRVRALPRPLRRAVLTFIDALDPATAAEDTARHPIVWKRLAERLHPHEWAGTHPDAAVVFAALRGTRSPLLSPLGQAIVTAGDRRPDRFLVSHHAVPTAVGTAGGRAGGTGGSTASGSTGGWACGTVSVRVRTFAAFVEQAVADGDAASAAALLLQRPGELWRRMDHLLRLAGDDPDALRIVLDAAALAAPRVSPNVLAGAAAELQGRDKTVPAEVTAISAALAAAVTAPEAAGAAAAGSPGPGGLIGAALRRAWGAGRPAAAVRIGRGAPITTAAQAVDRGPAPGTPRRTFFPKGDVVRTWTEPERRAQLPADAIAELRATVDAELSGRADGTDRFDVAVIDAALAQVPAPMRERAGSEQLAGWPRGSVRNLADAETLRLFLHWTDTDQHRVDLDLSCAFYNRTWIPVGHCDYTRLRFRHAAAVHSGDLTSAPPPQGATEYLDLNRSALLASKVAWAVPVILSYNDVPFESLAAAFAGFSLPQDPATQFDANRVMQRFALRGNAKSLAPMILDVRTGAVMWIDASLSMQGYGHDIGTHGARLGRLAADLWEHFDGGTRATLLDVVAWHAAARAGAIRIIHADGTTTDVPPGDPAAIREAASQATGAPSQATGASTGGAWQAGGAGAAAGLNTSRVLAASVDADRLAATVGAEVGEGSAALLVDGRPGAPWTPVTAADLLAGLIPR